MCNVFPNENYSKWDPSVHMSDCFIYFYMYITQNLTLFLEHRIAWGVFKIIIESSICFAFV